MNIFKSSKYINYKLSHSGEKGSTNKVSIYFFWCDTDKIKSVAARQIQSIWILEVKEIENLEVVELLLGI